MEHSSPVSKIVATATKTTWAQAYSAGKLHLCLSLNEETDGNIASLGKDVLEKIQREFFALDEKNLSTLKTVVETVTKTVSPDTSFSLVLTTIVSDVLYIIIANAGSVMLKRGDNISIVGEGEKDAVVGFSGKLQPDDIVIAATSGLLKTVSYDNLQQALTSMTPHEIGESLAPFLHEHATGTEAALVWKMIGSKITDEEKDVTADTVHSPEHPNDTLALDEHEPEEKTSSILPDFSQYLSKVTFPKIKLGKRQLIICAVVVLVIVLIGGLFFEKVSRQNSKEETAAAAFLTPQKQKYDDARALMSLNKSLAVEELQQVKTDTEAEKNKFPTGSKAFFQLDAFLAQVNQSLGGKSSTGSSQIQVFFDASKNSQIPTVSAITSKGGVLAVIGTQKGGILGSDGSVTSPFNGADSIHGITADEKNIYVLTGNTVEQITKTNGTANTIIQKQASPISIDTFGGNVYLLSGADKTIYKYRPTAYDKENYFTKDTTLTSASSISIDSSIYVVSDGKILKFTRGASDSFTYSGKPLSSTAQVYTDTDYTNLYLLDPVKKTATVLSKTGNIITEISLKGMKNITSIAADEKTKKMYVAANNKIYSIGF